VPYTLLRGSFVIRYPDEPRQGPEPDGDTLKFAPDTPALIDRLPRTSGRPADLNSRGVSIRLEAIDALETHFNGAHQELLGANAARDALLAQLGFTNVQFFEDLPNKVRSADQDSVRGHVLTNGIDANGRVIAFVYPGEHQGPDGTAVFVDEPLVDRSVNASLLAAGLAYPAFYSTLPADLRDHLAISSVAARQAGAGIWPRSTADPAGSATVNGLAAAEALVIWPKLFRRIVPYLAAGHTSFDDFEAWLREDAVNRDDAIFRLDTGQPANLHDILVATGDRIRMTSWPDSFIITPDPPVAGTTVNPTTASGAVLIVAALPNPIGADRGHEAVTVLNTTAAAVALDGWGLSDSGGGRHGLGGTLDAGGVLQVTVDAALQLGNRGDTIVLTDAVGRTVDTVSYKADAVREGRTICFGR